MKIKKLSSMLFVFACSIFSIIVGFLGAYAGSHGTSLLWRRAGIATLVTIISYLSSGLNINMGWIVGIWHITCMSLWGAYSCGYGVPDDDYPERESADEGSDIGWFWTMLFRKSMTRRKAHRMGDYFTRSTVAIMKCTCVVSIPIIKGNWIVYALASLGIILTNALISWRGLGEIKTKIFGKEVELLWSDIINYTIEGLCYFAIIFWSIL